MHDGDIDPVEEIRAIRRKHDRQFKTMEAYFAHLRTVPSADVLLAQVREKIAKTEAKKAKGGPASRPTPRRRRAVAHA